MNHKKQFFKFVIPSVVSMLVFNLYTMVDGIYVARFVGEHALSAVNISMPYVNFIFAFSILCWNEYSCSHLPWRKQYEKRK